MRRGGLVQAAKKIQQPILGTTKLKKTGRIS